MKKIAVGMISSILMLALVACGNSTAETESSESEIMEIYEENVSEETESELEEEYEEVEEVTEPVFVERELLWIDGFSEGYSWAKYAASDNRKDEKYGLINEDGEVIFTAESSGTKVSNGITLCEKDDVLTIYNTSGETLFYFQNTPEDSMEVLGYAEGKFVIRENITSFTDNNKYLYLMDGNGDAVTDKFEVTDMRWVTDFSYIGNGIYFGDNWEDGTYIFNTENNILFSVENKGDIVPFYEGKSVAFGKPIQVSDMQSKDTMISWNQMEMDKKPISGEENMSYYFSSKDANEGIFYLNGWFYDYDFNPLFTLTNYGADVKIYGVSTYSGGYASVTMTGADAYPYLVILDRQGNEMFEPYSLGKKEATFMGYFGQEIFDNGRFFYPLYNFSGESGLGCVSFDGRYRKYEDVDRFYILSIDEKYIYYDKNNGTVAYISIDSGKVYNTVREVAEGTVVESESSTAEKSYIDVNDFSIEGKWKNIGEGTFGQAQQGAIIVFNGSVCNFFSPQDTYAFYKDGVNWVLDCTSFMSTDTLSFTVKIVDENHIDIYRGSTFVEMQRVD